MPLCKPAERATPSFSRQSLNSPTRVTSTPLVVISRGAVCHTSGLTAGYVMDIRATSRAQAAILALSTPPSRPTRLEINGRHTAAILSVQT
ncbi:MAG: hypothetical protein RMJ19_01525 [Gemmatales bacterium]|nr:hypothetical protein [Gemmatales bacterium]MCS7159125.1 hypothetical protein [Gemmatales bacterium]MDW8174325.1 hypothetical protein [Gemmatales bacterium]MDW8222080.1 hypothetical protein [Gemmatales bacterium]